MKHFISTLFFLLVFPLSVTLVQAANTVSYPIPNLGNCRDKQECYYYCQIPQNQASCSTYRESLNQTNILGDTTATSPNASVSRYTFPISQLGNCASKEECLAYCNKIENHASCIAFSKEKRLISPEPKDSSPGANVNNRLVEEAKRVLGCDYKTTCRDFCNLKENKSKCEQFIKSFYENDREKPHLSVSPKPSGSSSEFSVDCTNPKNREKCIKYSAMCGTFCNKNQGFCSGTIPTYPPISIRPLKSSTQINSTLKKVQEISGCKTNDECSSYCNEHADICQGIYNIAKPSPTLSLTPHNNTSDQ